MSSKKSNIASQALLDMDTIVSAIKEESKKSLNMMLELLLKILNMLHTLKNV